MSRLNWRIPYEDVFDRELFPVSHCVYFHPQICVGEFFEFFEEASNQIRMDPGQEDGYQQGENLQEHVEILTSDLDDPWVPINDGRKNYDKQQALYKLSYMNRSKVLFVKLYFFSMMKAW